jgi:hypothetical protein
MKALSILLLGLAGCATANKVYPNLATRLLPKHPQLQHICDYAGGCQNVSIKCTRYDGSGNTDLRNQTYWNIETGSVDGGNWEYGVSFQDNNHIDTDKAIDEAISLYWRMWSVHQELYKTEPKIPVYPKSTSCDKDCLK